MDIFQAILLGFVQGVFEWLPVSSEAVITILMTYLGKSAATGVNTAIWLHTGTMLAALLYFRKEFFQLTEKAFSELKTPQNLFRGEGELSFIVVATFFTSALGGTLYLFGIKELLNYPSVFSGLMAVALFITGILRLKQKQTEAKDSIGLTDSVATGILQGFAVIPGVSRSGSTVFGLLYRGFSSKDAFKLSFLLSVPAVFIANIGLNIFSGFAVTSNLVVAAVTAFFVGYASIDAVLKVADRSEVAYMCFILGFLALLPLVL